MAKSLIPLRPEDFVSPLSQPEQAALTWYVLSGCPRKEAFLLFARPDMLASSAKAAIDDYIKQFYARKEVKEYLEAYEKTVRSFLHPEPAVKAHASTNTEERKAQAKTKLVEFAMSLADHIEDAEDPEMVLKLADKVGLLDQDEQIEEAPRRYLPVTCTDCAYKKFVEENCENDDSGTSVEEEKE